MIVSMGALSNNNALYGARLGFVSLFHKEENRIFDATVLMRYYPQKYQRTGICYAKLLD